MHASVCFVLPPVNRSAELPSKGNCTGDKTIKKQFLNVESFNALTHKELLFVEFSLASCVQFCRDAAFDDS